MIDSVTDLAGPLTLFARGFIGLGLGPGVPNHLHRREDHTSLHYSKRGSSILLICLKVWICGIIYVVEHYGHVIRLRESHIWFVIVEAEALFCHRSEAMVHGNGIWLA